LRIREVERVAQVLSGLPSAENELTEPWASIVVAVDGKVSTFSPEFMEVAEPAYGNFVFGNILDGEIEQFAATDAFRRAHADIKSGVEACRTHCNYFAVCGGGSPVNKLCEKGDLGATETDYCRLTTQASVDALRLFLAQTAGASAARAMSH
jgi:uncharacterized protein